MHVSVEVSWLVLQAPACILNLDFYGIFKILYIDLSRKCISYTLLYIAFLFKKKRDILPPNLNCYFKSDPLLIW